MIHSTNRILTTHTGSLPRPAKVVELLLAEEKKPGARKAELQAAVRGAVADVVAKQIECGIDIINDGEQGRTDYTVHVLKRLTGYEGESAPPMGTGEPDFPELAAQLKFFASPFQYRPACSGPVTWKDWPAAQADIDLAKAVMQGAKAEDLFMTSPSPGQIARYLKNNFYPNDETYIYALADVMRREYQAIVEAGFILQLDCPDLAMLRHMVYLDLPLADYREIIATNVAALKIFRRKECVCMCVGVRPWRRTTPTLISRTLSTSCCRRARTQSRSRPPTRGTSTSGKSGAT
jgi:5-methyltetrahydropteroyltriglutamate--homocysteine methyltransferase